MKRPMVGSYEEARLFALRAFSRLTTTQKLRWLADMAAFIEAANPETRRRRLGLAAPARQRARR